MNISITNPHINLTEEKLKLLNTYFKLYKTVEDKRVELKWAVYTDIYNKICHGLKVGAQTGSIAGFIYGLTAAKFSGNSIYSITAIWVGIKNSLLWGLSGLAVGGVMGSITEGHSLNELNKINLINAAYEHGKIGVINSDTIAFTNELIDDKLAMHHVVIDLDGLGVEYDYLKLSL